MRVVVVAPFDKPWYTGYYLLDALKSMEIQVEAFDYRRVSSEIGVEKMNETLSEYILWHKPDLVLSLKAELVNPQLVKDLKQRTKTAMWFFDYENPIPTWLVDLAEVHDFFFTVCRGQVHDFPRQINALWLPEAYCDFRINPVEVSNEEKKKYGSDVALIATDKPRPIEVLKRVVAEGFDVKIWGAQVNDGWRNAGLEKYWMGYRTTDEELSKICASSKIILGTSEEKKKNCDVCFSARVFQVLGAKGFLLEERSKGIEAMLRDKQDFVLWKDEDDLVAKIRYYMDRDVERHMIADSGYKTVKQSHTFRVRVETLLWNVGLWHQ